MSRAGCLGAVIWVVSTGLAAGQETESKSAFRIEFDRRREILRRFEAAQAARFETDRVAADRLLAAEFEEKRIAPFPLDGIGVVRALEEVGRRAGVPFRVSPGFAEEWRDTIVRFPVELRSRLNRGT